MNGILYYSSISWNTALVAEGWVEYFRLAGVNLTIQNLAADTTWQPTQGTYDFVLLACGTYGHGQLQNILRNCTENLWEDTELKWLPCAAIGLGDHRYDVEYNMYAGDILENWLREHGGRIVIPTLKINRSPVKEKNANKVREWAKSFAHNLRNP